MVMVVENAKGEIERLTNGAAPARPEVDADNAKQHGEVKKTEAEPNADDDVEGEDGLTPRQKRDFSAAMLKSIGKKHREKIEAEEFAADQYNQRRLAEQRAENLERQLATLQGNPPQKVVEAPKKPERAAFDSDDAYQDALVDFRVKETLAREKQQQAEQQAQERQQQVIEAAKERLRKAAELVPDFAEKTESAEMNVPVHIAGYMQESEMFAELGYHFAQHPEALERLAKLSPAKALVEVGKIESTLQPFASRTAAGADGKVNGQKPKPSETESAASTTAASGTGADPSQTESGKSAAGPSQHRAPVIKPLNAGSASQVEKAPQDMNIRETIEDWKKRNKSNLGLRRRH